ncbi:MAG: M56 family metallopeptidase [Bacteroidota bacterium]|nr:M56 family metallopeptidase [Bacteroidota bacterium]
MAELIRYLLLVNIFLVLLSLFFRLILSKESWFKTNRIVILAGIALSLAIPLINFNILPSPEQALIVIPEVLGNIHSFQPDFILDEIQIYGTAPRVFPWISFFQGLYLTGIIIMLMFFLNRISNIRILQKTYPMKWFDELFITVLPANYPSFSFLGTVYHPGPFSSDDKMTRLILEHERVHISQKHSWDLIFIEIIQLAFFYNPAVYTLRKQLVLTHEFLADQIVAKKDRKQYSLALFQSFFNVPHFTLSHAFNQSTSLKRRIIMLQKNTQNRWAAARYFLLVPMIGTFMLLSAFTTVNAQEKKTKEEVAKEVVEIKLKEAGFDKKEIEEIQKRIDKTETAKREVVKSEKDPYLIFIVEDMPIFDGKGVEHFKKWVQSQVKYPEEAKKKKISGTVYANFVINEEGKVESIKIVRGAHELLDKEVIRVIKLSPVWIPGKQRGKNVKVSMAIPVKFQLN